MKEIVLILTMWLTPEPSPICDEVYFTEVQGVNDIEIVGDIEDGTDWAICTISLTPVEMVVEGNDNE